MLSPALPLFPEFLPDEPVYSAVARYGDQMKFESVSALDRVAFGGARIPPEVGLTCGLEALAARLPAAHAADVDRLLRLHTTLRYHVAFAPDVRRARAERELRGSRSRAVAVLGFTRYPYLAVERLRYCPTCVAEAVSDGSVPHWRRAHQLPGVLVCVDHGSALLASSVENFIGASTRRFVSLARALDTPGTPLADPRACASDLAREVARSSRWLLDHDTRVESASALRLRYHAWLRACGLTFRGQHVTRSRDLLDLAQTRLGADVLTSLACAARGLGAAGACEADDGRWLRRMFEHPEAVVPTLLRLLWLRVLDVPVERFFLREPPVAAAPVPPPARAPLDGPCGNPQCSAYDPPVPRPLPHAAHAPDLRVVVSCPACGFGYAQRRDETDSRFRTVLATGPLWDRRLEELVAAPSATPREIRTALGLCAPVVHRIALARGLWHPRWSACARRSAEGVRAPADQRVLRGHRERWMTARGENPAATRTDLVRIARRTYFYLLRADKDWLEANSPPRQPLRRGVRQIDWGARDDEYETRARLAVADILARPGRPIQVTVKMIGRLLGKATLGHELARLPRAKAYVASAVEAGPAFAERRVRWAIAEFAARGDTPTRKQIWKLAALGHGHYHRVLPAIIDAVAALEARAQRGASEAGGRLELA